MLHKNTGRHDTLEIQVTDTGIGIHVEDQKKLFKLYGLLESSREVNAKGVGLGLFICKKIVNKFKGDITV